MTLVGQLVFGIALGGEDLVDHDEPRHDPAMAVLAGKLSARRKDCAPPAGKSTLNRLELGGVEPTRYRRIAWDGAKIEALFVDLFVEAHRAPAKADHPRSRCHRRPAARTSGGHFFHGDYDCYCYLPLYIFCGPHLLASKLRRADIDAAAGAVEETARIVAQIRARWPQVRIVLRADSGFAREALMSWCEANGVDFLFGRPKRASCCRDRRRARRGRGGEQSQRPAGSTRDSWSRQRRVIAKAEWTGGEANPRFVVTSLSPEDTEPRQLYEEIYCARGDMENRIKECQLDLFADRTSAATMRANQLRLWFASMAYVLLCARYATLLCSRPNSPGPPAARSASSSSKSARWRAPACGASNSPWSRSAPISANSTSPTLASPTSQRADETEEASSHIRARQSQHHQCARED